MLRMRLPGNIDNLGGEVEKYSFPAAQARIINRLGIRTE